MIYPGTVADRLDAIRRRPIGAPIIYHADALDVIREWSTRIGSAGRYYLDPPYDGVPGYQVACRREHVLVIAEESARRGGRVVLS